MNGGFGVSIGGFRILRVGNYTVDLSPTQDASRKINIYTDSMLRTSTAILVTSHRVGGVDQQSTMFHCDFFGLVRTFWN